MKNRATQSLKDCFHVDIKLLPFKFHYFFMFGAFASMQFFMPVVGKEIGISVTAVGIVYSTLHILLVFANPITGLLVDYFQTIKIFLVILLIISITAYCSVLSIPPINDEPENSNLVYVQVSELNESVTLLNISKPFGKSCIENLTKIQCEVEFEQKITTKINKTRITTYLANSINITYVNASDAFKKRTLGGYWIIFHSEDMTLSEIKGKVRKIKFRQCSPDIDKCSDSTETDLAFSTYQFWLFMIFIVLGGITSSVAMNLSSVACNEILSDRLEDYGRQRLYGTISWGLLCPLAGLCNDLFDTTGGKNFTSSMYLMIIFMSIDIIILILMHIPKAHVSSNMCQDIGKILTSLEILVFSLGVMLIGIFQSIPAVYEFWFLEDLGGSRTLMGLTVAMQCLVAEAPFLFFSGWFVKNLGHYLCLVGVFAGYTARFYLYSILQDPWFALPIDILHGVTYGLFHGSMVSFAKLKAPAGMEATLIGLFAGLSEGLGCALGSFISGFGVEELGPRYTFFIGSLVSFVCLILFCVASYVFRNSAKGVSWWRWKKRLDISKTATES